MENYLTCDEVAEIFKVKRTTVYSWIKDGQLAAIKFGIYYRVSESAVKEFEKSKLVNQQGA